MKPNHRKINCGPKSVISINYLVMVVTIAFLTAFPGHLSATTIQIIGLGDSLTQGTMDATKNTPNTMNAYLQKTVESLSTIFPFQFSHPLYGYKEQRLTPCNTPTNLGVDGADIFSLERIEYYKRVGASTSFPISNYLCDSSTPFHFRTTATMCCFP